MILKEAYADSPVVIHIPLWWATLMMKEAVHVWGRGHVKISVPSLQSCCEPKTTLKVQPPNYCFKHPLAYATQSGFHNILRRRSVCIPLVSFPRLRNGSKWLRRSPKMEGVEHTSDLPNPSCPLCLPPLGPLVRVETPSLR